MALVLSGLVCAWSVHLCLDAHWTCSIVADPPSRLLLTNEILYKGLVVCLLAISPTEV